MEHGLQQVEVSWQYSPKSCRQVVKSKLWWGFILVVMLLGTFTMQSLVVYWFIQISGQQVFAGMLPHVSSAGVQQSSHSTALNPVSSMQYNSTFNSLVYTVPNSQAA